MHSMSGPVPGAVTKGVSEDAVPGNGNLCVIPAVVQICTRVAMRHLGC